LSKRNDKVHFFHNMCDSFYKNAQDAHREEQKYKNGERLKSMSV